MSDGDSEVDGSPFLRIGELSRRVGVTTDRLRAWEHRYGLLAPARTEGGFRLYSRADERRIRRMLHLLADGHSAAQAAHAVLGTSVAEPQAPTTVRERLGDAVARFDEPAADSVLSRSLATLGEDATMREVIYPLLRELGEAWERGRIDIAQEHFASNLIQRRLTGLLPAGPRPEGAPHAVLACPPGEQHVLGLIGLGVALRRRGWRVTYLGADTPIINVARTASLVRSTAVVLAVTLPHCLSQQTAELRRLAGERLLLLAGAGADVAVAERLGGRYIDADPVEAAGSIACSFGS